MIKKFSQAGSVYFFLKPLLGFLRWGLLGVLVFGFVFVVGVGFWIGGKYQNLGSITEKITTPSQGSVVYDKDGVEMYRYYDAGEKREIVPLDDIPEVMQLAVVAMEDENFYYNEDGIPWSNLAGAALKCLRPSSGECRGGSGLSQQLMKKTLTNRTKATLDNKIDELLGAYKFNQEVTKQDVIRLYLNVVPFGRNTYGVQEASKSYFGKPINDKKDGKFTLTNAEACFIGSMLPAPEDFAVGVKDKLDNKPNKDYDTLVERKNICLEKLATKEIRGSGKGVYINSQDYEKSKKEEPKFLKFQGENIKYGHLKNYVTTELVDRFKNSKEPNPYGFRDETDLLTRGLKIKTTFDLKMQSKIEEIVKKGVENNVKPNGGNNAAAVVLDGPTGNILAMVGSVDFNNKDIQGEVNMVTSARQPGSSIKPYVYASAFNNGFNPSTVLIDTDIDFGKYKPLNFDKKFYGPVSMRYALQNSLNIPAVKALYLSAEASTTPDGEGGLLNFKKFIDKTGLTFPFWERGICGVATALGGCEIKMIDHATGINTLLQEGKLNTSTPFLEIVSKEKNFVNGEETIQDLYNLAKNSPNSPYPKKEDSIDPVIARQVENVMSDVGIRDNSIWGDTANNLTLKDWTGENSVAAKTGTTNDYKDAWTVGGSPYYTVVVWTGNTDGKPMLDKVASASIAGPIWKDIMVEIHKDKTKKGFSKEGLEKVSLDPATGLLGSGKTEWLTSKQKKILQEAKVTGSSAKNSIYTTRTPMIGSSVRINKADGKLIDENSDLPDYLKGTLNCSFVASEFPAAANWSRGGAASKSCPTEKSDLKKDQVKISIGGNVQSGQRVGEDLVFSANHPIPDAKIKNITILIDGQSVGSIQDQNTINIKVSGINGPKNVEVIVQDEFGQTEKTTYNSVLFGNGTCDLPKGVLLLPGQPCPLNFGNTAPQLQLVPDSPQQSPSIPSPIQSILPILTNPGELQPTAPQQFPQLQKDEPRKPNQNVGQLTPLR
jgi:membrane peptidoglycan carboxypeptidase